MSQENVYVKYEEIIRTQQSSLELALSELRSLHEAQADDLQEAFSPDVRNLLRQLSEDDSIFQYPIPEENESSPSESFHSTEDASDYWKATRMTFKFICDEFMTAPRDQQMGRFQTFLDQVRGTASQIRLPEGANQNPDRNAMLRQCFTAVKTMKEVLSSKFASLQKYAGMQMEQGNRPYAGRHQTTEAPRFTTETSFVGGHRTADAPGFVMARSFSGGHCTVDETGSIPSNVPQTEPASSVGRQTIFKSPQGFAILVPQTEPEYDVIRPEIKFMYSGASNPEMSRVIRDNPTIIRGGHQTTDAPRFATGTSFVSGHHTTDTPRLATGTSFVSGHHTTPRFATGTSFAGGHYTAHAPGAHAAWRIPSNVPQTEPASSVGHQTIFKSPQGFAILVPQTEPEYNVVRPEINLMYSGASNPEASRVIRDNLTTIRGAHQTTDASRFVMGMRSAGGHHTANTPRFTMGTSFVRHHATDTPRFATGASFAGGQYTARAPGFPTGRIPSNVPQTKLASSVIRPEKNFRYSGASNTIGSSVIRDNPTTIRGRHQMTDAPGFATGMRSVGGPHTTDAPRFATGTDFPSGNYTANAPGFATGRIPSNVPQTKPASSVEHQNIFRCHQGFAIVVPQTEPASSVIRPETNFRYSGASNTEESRVIRDNPAPIRGRHQTTDEPGFATARSLSGGHYTIDETGSIPSNVSQTEPASSVGNQTIFKSSQGFAIIVPQTEPEYNVIIPETNFMYSGASNPEVSRVIRDNPISIRSPGDMSVLTRTGPITPPLETNVIGTPSRPSIVQASEEGSQGESTPSPPIRPLRGQKKKKPC